MINQEPKQKKNASFLIRTGMILIDLLFIFAILIPLMLIVIQTDEKGELIINSINYYIWFTTFIFVIFIYYFLIPFFLNLKTISMLILKLEIISLIDEKKIIIIFKKNCLTTLLWILVLLSFISFVPPTTAFKLMSEKNPDSISDIFSTLEIAGISVPAILSPLVMLFCIFNYVSVGIGNKSISISEKIYNYRIVYSNKFEKTIEEFKNNIEPIKILENEIIWKDNDGE